jgi:dTDP-4-amino-4,6-dideoxygalactose transaminase
MTDSSDTVSRTINHPIPLLDLRRENEPLRDEMLAALAGVFDSGRFLHGPDVTELESEVAAYCQTEHAIGCASGSDALLLALMAMDIGPGDEVILPSFTFFATASAVWRLGASIVFVDIDASSFNIDPAAIDAVVSPRTKAIIPVHLFGQCAEMPDICAIAKKHNLLVIEDAAQAIGADHEGRAAGSWGDVGCLSFYPTKNLGGCGDGGMLTTNNADLAARLRLFASHGMSPRYHHHVVGINSRLDSMQAALLRVKLRHLERWTESRQQNAARYDQLLTEAGLDGQLGLPSHNKGSRHVWNQYSILVPSGGRDQLRTWLSEGQIGSEIYYPLPLHLQPCFKQLGYAEGSLPETERAAHDILNLPIFPDLGSDEQRRIVGRLSAFFATRGASAA